MLPQIPNDDTESLEDPKEEAAETPEEETQEEQAEPAPTDEQGNEILDDELVNALETILKACEIEDDEVRVRQLREARMLDSYFNHIQDLFWDQSARDWRSASTVVNTEDDDSSSTYRKIVNIYRAHGESVIAALSIDLPNLVFIPDDAESPDDIETSIGYGKAVELISKHNDAPLKAIQALQILWNQGTVFAYSYTRTDPKYGVVRIPDKKQVQIKTFDTFCSHCGNRIASLETKVPTEPIQCSYCGFSTLPQTGNEQEETVEQIVGYTEDPKAREFFEFFGIMNVKVPAYARRQEHCGYLILKTEEHHAMLEDRFESLKDRLSGDSGDDYERYIRLSSVYGGVIPIQLRTLTSFWVRPWMYQLLNDDDLVVKLKAKFPNGCMSMWTGSHEFIEAVDESLDDHWTMSYDPLSNFVHGQPLGKPLAPVQDMVNDMLNLTLQTAEYGIPETFANPRVLSFDKYGKSSAAPGMVTPAIPEAGKSMQDAFFTLKTASLSPEIKPFTDQLESSGQFVVGSFPSIYGGSGEGSKTATEYQQSRSQALQRLSTTWKKFTSFWVKTMAKAAVEYVEQLKEDEKFVKKDNGKWMNVWIAKSKMTGKIGHVEAEGSEQLPQSWQQLRDVVMQLLQLNNQEINAVLFAPENSEQMKLAFGRPDIFIPGEASREKQLGEIFDIIAGDPSVSVDETDNHGVEMEIIRNYLTGMQGIQLKKENPQAFVAIVQHYQQHQAMMMPPLAPEGNKPPAEKLNIKPVDKPVNSPLPN